MNGATVPTARRTNPAAVLRRAAEERAPVSLAAMPGEFLLPLLGDVLHYDRSVHGVVPLPWLAATIAIGPLHCDPDDAVVVFPMLGTG